MIFTKKIVATVAWLSLIAATSTFATNTVPPVDYVEPVTPVITKTVPKVENKVVTPVKPTITPAPVKKVITPAVVKPKAKKVVAPVKKVVKKVVKKPVVKKPIVKKPAVKKVVTPVKKVVKPVVKKKVKNIKKK